MKRKTTTQRIETIAITSIQVCILCSLVSVVVVAAADAVVVLIVVVVVVAVAVVVYFFISISGVKVGPRYLWHP